MASASSDVVVVEENVRHETTERVRVRVHGCTSLETVGTSNGGDKFWDSSAVQLAGHEWKLRLAPKGFGTGKGTHFGAAVALSSGQCIVKARYKLAIVENSQTLVSHTNEFNWLPTKNAWGPTKALTIADFKSLAAAHGDTLTFEIEITTFGEPTSAVQPRAADEAAAATAAAALAVVKDLGALLDGGKNTDVVFRVGDEEIAAHRLLLAARSPVFEAMFAQHWSEPAASSSSSSAEGGGAIAIEGTAPAAFKQLLRFAYTGCCEDGALAAMADHLFEAAGKFGLPLLQAAARRQMLSSLDAAKVCDYFALAHAHEDGELTDACAELVSADMFAVTQSEGFKRLSAERPLLACALMQSIGELKSPEGRKRKRDEGEGGAGRATDLTLTAEKVKRLKVGELRTELASRGLATDGAKADLAARLEAAL